jgi:signal transduction histidine kinase
VTGFAHTMQSQRAQVCSWLHDRPLQMLEYIAAGGYRDAPDLEHLRAVAAAAAGELREFIDGRDAPAGGGLVASLEEAVTDAQLLAPGLTVRLIIGVVEEEPDANVVGGLAAATREALTNVRRHAHAREATVRCAVAHGAVVVRIEDDGSGFTPGPRSAGRGIRGSLMRRLRDLGGSASIDSAPGRGTVVRLALDIGRQRRRPRPVLIAQEARA